MKTKRYLKWMWVLAILAGIAGCSRHPSKPTSIEGHWTGADLPPRNGKSEITITGNQFEYRGSDSNDWCRGEFVINEDVQPIQLSFTIKESPQNVGKVVLAIGDRQGEEMKVALAEPGVVQRPADFTPNRQVRVVSLKRN